MRERMAGRFEASDKILHIWFNEPVHLRNEEEVRAFFLEAEERWLNPTPGPYYLLVNYTHLSIEPAVTQVYAASIQRFQHKLLGTYRYKVESNLTATAVRLGNMKLASPSHIYPTEAAARAAIREASGKR